MLLEQKTIEELGFDFASLSPTTKKKVWANCDYCKEDYLLTWGYRVKCNAILAKDACNKCRYKKRDELGIIKYGCTNPMHRQEVKDKVTKVFLEKYGATRPFVTQEIKDKIKKTNIERYGVENAAQSAEVRKKMATTNLERYGTEHVLNSQVVREKVKATCIRKYGADSFVGSEIGKQKTKEGVQKKYGVDNLFQSEELKAKGRKTNLERYGNEHARSTPEIAQKAKETCLEKYGVENPAQSSEIKDKIKTTNLQRYGCNPAQTKAVQDKAQVTRILNGNQKVYQGKSNKELALELGIPRSTFNLWVRSYGYELAVKMTPKVSSLEIRMAEWFNSVGINFMKSFTVEGRRPDFVIPSHNLIIEVDGLFWHSEKNRPNNYHFDKKELYIKHGYDSCFFREDEIHSQWHIVTSIIKNKLGMNDRRIGARTCQIMLVPPDIAKTFFALNHLMGSGRGDTYGLYYRDDLVMAAQFKRLKDSNYEISRICSLNGVNVIGGFSRLLGHFAHVYKPSSLLTFVDRRYGKGDYLENLGFRSVACYKSFRWSNGSETIHRMQFPSNTGYEAGFFKVWDCGQAKFIKNFIKVI